ncbi:Major phosphate-irrepressible acid phosphatase precursor [Clavibacter michiganensis]|uniref:acid phosphatase n=1 Tax=Clavibacter michiganensis TaxID=28447 RepID=A0A251XXG7_9MICO|nr:Major phosphate-irrepressible acid phosphatase precursor [Clavibacter michiganensis]
MGTEVARLRTGARPGARTARTPPIHLPAASASRAVPTVPEAARPPAPTRGTIIRTPLRRPRTRTATLLSTTTVLGLLLTGTGATAATAADAPAASASPVVPSPIAPFDPAVLDAPYPSNTVYDFVPMLDAFTGLKATRPDIMKMNDRKTITINQAATKAQSARAIVDQYADMSITMSDGLGRDLGAIYRTAREAGQLPKTAALLAKSGGLVGRYSSSNPPKQHFDNPRPYVAFPLMLKYRDKVGGNAWNGQDGSYPSGHTSQAFWQGTSLATMLPELAPQILARASDASNNRIIMGAHYPLDVMAGRMMGQKIVERRWSDPEFRTLFEQASTELRTVLEAKCGAALDVCIARDKPYLPTAQALAVYEQRMSYGFPVVGNRGEPMTVPAGAESLLISSHPDLTPEQRRQVLALTAIDSGEPLDAGTEGSWQRIDLAAAMAAVVVITADGTVSLVATGRR